jgi:hypothetical protein
MQKIWKVLRVVGTATFDFVAFCCMFLVSLSIVYQLFWGDGATRSQVAMRDEIIHAIDKNECQYYCQVTECWPSNVADRPDYLVEYFGPFRSIEAAVKVAEEKSATYELLADNEETILDSALINIQTDCYDLFEIKRYETINICKTCIR